MAKDPAFLFYSSDFISGIQDLTMEERGQYITLLCLQHQKGHLTKKMIDICVGNAAADVMAKFKQDAGGLYYNVRLEAESQKRSEHSEKQRQRAKDGWEKRKTDATANAAAQKTAMPLENENENINEIKNENKGGAGENFIIPKMCEVWYQAFPLYTKDKQKDFHAMASILQFMAKQAGTNDIATNPDHFLKVVETLKALSDMVSRETFWTNKPLSSIANNIQEFYNKIKNPQHEQRTSKNGQKGNSNLRTEVQAEFNRRYPTVQQD